jgi:hypothetical protein
VQGREDGSLPFPDGLVLAVVAVSGERRREKGRRRSGMATYSLVMIRVLRSSAEAMDGVMGMTTVTKNRSLLRIALARRATSAALIWLHGPCLFKSNEAEVGAHDKKNGQDEGEAHVIVDGGDEVLVLDVDEMLRSLNHAHVGFLDRLLESIAA